MNSPSRRDLLVSLLGLPALAGGCASTPALPDGEIVGANVSLGHRLRETAPTGDQVRDWSTVPIVIVGAGVAGLSAGWRLARAKFDRFVVLELESAPGGTSRSGNNGVVPHPWGAHYLPAPMADNHALLTLLREMNLIEGTTVEGQPIYPEHVLCRDPQERLWAYGQWHEGLYLAAGADAEDRRQHRAFFTEVDRWIGRRDGRGRRPFALPTSNASDDPDVLALDRLTMAEWMAERRFTSSRLLWMVDYGCRDDYGCRPTEVSAWAGLFYFASRRRKPGGESQPLLTWPEGNGKLVAHLASRVKDRLRTDLAVMDIHPTDPAGKRGVDVVAYSQKQQRFVGYHAEQVIFAGPHFLKRYVVRPYRTAPPRHLSAFTYSSWMVANLHLNSRLREPGIALAWDNVFYDSPSLGYVVATHQAGLDFGPTILTYYYPLAQPDIHAARKQLLDLGWSEWAELALSDIERVHPDLRKRVTRLDVMRWGHAMIRPTPGFISSRDRRQAGKPYRGVHFAHSDLSGLALFEEAFDQGIRAGEEVLRAQGKDVENL